MKFRVTRPYDNVPIDTMIEPIGFIYIASQAYALYLDADRYIARIPADVLRADPAVLEPTTC